MEYQIKDCPSLDELSAALLSKKSKTLVLRLPSGSLVQLEVNIRSVELLEQGKLDSFKLEGATATGKKEGFKGTVHNGSGVLTFSQ